MGQQQHNIIMNMGRPDELLCTEVFADMTCVKGRCLRGFVKTSGGSGTWWNEE
jgi:hypothetical protein